MFTTCKMHSEINPRCPLKIKASKHSRELCVFDELNVFRWTIDLGLLKLRFHLLSKQLLSASEQHTASEEMREISLPHLAALIKAEEEVRSATPQRAARVNYTSPALVVNGSRVDGYLPSTISGFKMIFYGVHFHRRRILSLAFH